MSITTPELAIVGAGVAGCALTARLRHLGWRGPITLVEAGQAAGGRAASRRSRRHPGWSLDHGAPFLNLVGSDPPALLQLLRATDRIRPWPPAGGEAPRTGVNTLAADGSLLEAPGPFAAEGQLYRGWPAMADVAEGMLELADRARQPGAAAAGAPAVVRRHGCRVESLERRDGRWRLHDQAGELLAEAAWLVLSGTLLAHPRCLTLLDCGQVPLVAASRPLGDAALDQALQAIARLRYDPRLALLLRLEAGCAGTWRALPFRHLQLNDAARARWGLERITLQPQAEGRCGVVAQARPADLVDSGLLHPARAGGTPDDEAAEIAALSLALRHSLAAWITEADLPPPADRVRMRWGGAFPMAPGLDRDAMVCPDSQVALCGDAISGPGFGRIEGAWRSGEWLAERLLPALSAPRR